MSDDVVKPDTGALADARANVLSRRLADHSIRSLDIDGVCTVVVCDGNLGLSTRYRGGHEALAELMQRVVRGIHREVMPDARVTGHGGLTHASGVIAEAIVREPERIKELEAGVREALTLLNAQPFAFQNLESLRELLGELLGAEPPVGDVGN